MKRTVEDLAARSAAGAKQKETKKASDERLRPHLQNIPGPKPGGLAEAMADPNYLANSLANIAKRREEHASAKTAFGIRTSKHDADTPDNRVHFAEGAMVDNPQVPMRVNPRPAARPHYVPKKK